MCSIYFEKAYRQILSIAIVENRLIYDRISENYD